MVRDRLVVAATREIGPLVGAGAVRVDGHPGRIDTAVPTGATLAVLPAALDGLRRRGRLTTPHRDPRVAVAHRDPDVVVVDKPHGMHVHPLGTHRDGTLVGALLWEVGARPDRPWGDWRPLPVHRLDRATSGLVAFTTHRDAHAAFSGAMAAGLVTRRYRAEVVGVVEGDDGLIELPLGRDPDLDYRRTHVPVSEGGQTARTTYRVVARRPDTTVLELTLGTGRTHQIRAHLALIGHPVVGDDLYAPTARGRADATETIALRAVSLAFPHPRTGLVTEVVVDAADSGHGAG